MTPAARVQSAIEVLDQVIVAVTSNGPPADRLLSDWFRTHRFAGSKDKRAIRDLVYAAIRACGPVPSTGRAAMLRLIECDPDIADLFDGSPYAPVPIAPGEAAARGGIAPQWLEDRLAASAISGDDAAHVLGRAPLDLRINTLKLTSGLYEWPVNLERLPVANALRAPAGTMVEQWAEYEQGLIEVQDLGSQLASQAVAAQPGELVIDLCAGAGGKTLALAAAMANSGTLIAADTDRTRLSRLAPRAERAGVRIASTILLDPGRELDALAKLIGRADRVLVDAPCSGTGTYRRNPEGRWRLTPRELGKLVALQARLLEIAAQLVKPSGQVTYVTCSLLDEEGAGQVDSFLADHPGWRATAPDLPLGKPRGPGWRMTPYHDGTDGFFVACLHRPC